MSFSTSFSRLSSLTKAGFSLPFFLLKLLEPKRAWSACKPRHTLCANGSTSAPQCRRPGRHARSTSRSPPQLRSAATSSPPAQAGTSSLGPYALLVQCLSSPLAQFKPGRPHAPRGEFRSVVRAQAFRQAALVNQPLQHTCYAPRTETGICFQRQALVGKATSTTLKMRTMRPFASPSTMKSIAHSWLARVSRGSAAGPRINRFRLRRRTAKPSSLYSR